MKTKYGGGKRRFLQILVMLWCWALVLCPLTGAAAEPAEQVVRVGYYETKGFQEYDAETGVYSGYSYEFLMALRQYMDLKYEFVSCDFAEGLELLKEGKIDMMNNVSKTEERELIYDFTSLDSGENIAYLAMKPGDTRVGYEDLKGIEGIRIGLAKDSIYSGRLVRFFQEESLNPEITWYDSRAAVTDAFDKEEVDAYIITSSTKSDEHIILSFSPDSYYIAASKNNQKLVDTLDSAIAELRLTDPYFELHLRDKYYGQATENYTVLTETEKAYIEKNPVARVLYNPDWYPLSYEEDGAFAGAIRGVYDLLEERTGLKFEFIPADMDDDTKPVSDYHVQIMAEQPSDFSGASLYGVRLTKSFISTPLTTISNTLLKPGDTIILVDGDYLSSVVQRIFGDKYQYLFCDSVEECIQSVKGKKADGTVMISYESEFYRHQKKYESLTYAVVDDGSYSLAIAVMNDADPILYNIIQKGLNAISTGEITNVFNNTLLSLQKENLWTWMFDHPIATVLGIVILAGLLVSMILAQLFIGKLRKQNEIIHKQNEALQHANQSTTNFFSRMSHDMRTPMNGILGMARLSADETDVTVLRRNLVKIEESGEYLLSLINDTLDFQRIESGRMQLKPEIVNCADILQNILQMVQPAADQKHIELQIINKNVVMDCLILVDLVRMKQIFLNLMSNAIKFTPEGGIISVESECLERVGMISKDRFVIRDTGIGMSKEFMDHYIFQPFSQEQNEVTGQYAGSGLGLSIVKSLVELMGGSISVESEVGSGTSFTIHLDFQRVDRIDAEQTAEDRKVLDSGMENCLCGKQILLAEDHPLNAEIAGKMLSKVGCYVTWVQNGRECVDTFAASAEYEFDMILMDIRMPQMDGLEAARQIRKLGRQDAKLIPIIAMTANAYEEDIKKSIESGMDGHLAKPVNPQDLYTRMEELLEKKNC